MLLALLLLLLLLLQLRRFLFFFLAIIIAILCFALSNADVDNPTTPNNPKQQQMNCRYSYVVLVMNNSISLYLKGTTSATKSISSCEEALSTPNEQEGRERI